MTLMPAPVAASWWWPKSGCRVGFTRDCNLVEQVGRLTIVRPGKAQIYGQVATDFPVIATIKERVMLAEIQARIASSKLHASCELSKWPDNAAQSRKPERAIDGGQEDVG